MQGLLCSSWLGFVVDILLQKEAHSVVYGSGLNCASEF